MKQKKSKSWWRALSIIAVYIAMQLGSVPVTLLLTILFKGNGYPFDKAAFHGMAWGLFIVNIIAIVAFILITRTDKKYWDIFTGKKASIRDTILWGGIGFFMALGGQMLAGLIEQAIGIQNGSENTARLTEVATVAPIIIVCIVLFAPILEEVVFRRVLFGGIFQKTNFWIASIASALIFAAVHNELEHLLIYLMPGLVFSYIYYRTKRIWTPIISHMLMNGFVMMVTLNQDKILEWEKQLQAATIFSTIFS